MEKSYTIKVTEVTSGETTKPRYKKLPKPDEDGNEYGTVVTTEYETTTRELFVRSSSVQPDLSALNRVMQRADKKAEFLAKVTG